MANTGMRAAMTALIGEPARRPPTYPAIMGPAGWIHQSRKERIKMTREDDRKRVKAKFGLDVPSNGMVLYAKDIVEREFLSFSPSTSVRDAAKTMAREHQGFVIVTSPAKVPMGIVTEWDLLAKVVAEGSDPSNVSLGEIMSTKLVSVDPSEGIDRGAQLMADEGTRRGLVVKDSQVLGVIRVRTILARMREYVDSVSAQIARAQKPMF